jgi:hypothetical protein
VGGLVEGSIDWQGGGKQRAPRTQTSSAPLLSAARPLAELELAVTDSTRHSIGSIEPSIHDEMYRKEASTRDSG